MQCGLNECIFKTAAFSLDVVGAIIRTVKNNELPSEESKTSNLCRVIGEKSTKRLHNPKDNIRMAESIPADWKHAFLLKYKNVRLKDCYSLRENCFLSCYA